MSHAELLKALRQSGRTNDQACELLAALASSFPPTDEITEALDACIDRIEDITESEKRAVEIIEAWDRKRNAPKLQVVVSAYEIPGFLRGSI